MDFETLIEASVTELETKTSSHRRIWRFGDEDRWDVDQEEGDIVFSFSDGTVVRAAVQIIGTLCTRNTTWLWPWANSSIREALTVDALKLKTYGHQHGIERLTRAKWPGSQAEAWSLTALAVKLCSAQGGYRCPDADVFVFMTFGKVSTRRDGEPLS